MQRRHVFNLWTLVVPTAGLTHSPGVLAGPACAPTQRDYLGPYFVSNAPVITELNRFGKPGERMRVTGTVLSARDGSPVTNAVVEVWQTDGEGRYHPQGNGDRSRYLDRQIDLRGTVHAAADGTFSFLSVVPGVYAPRPRHIHYRVSGAGHQVLVTQHYLSDGDAVPGGVCRSGPIDRRGGEAVFRAPAIYLSAR